MGSYFHFCFSVTQTLSKVFVVTPVACFMYLINIIENKIDSIISGMLKPSTKMLSASVETVLQVGTISLKVLTPA